MNDQKSIKALEEKAKDMYKYPPIVNQEELHKEINGIINENKPNNYEVIKN